MGLLDSLGGLAKVAGSLSGKGGKNTTDLTSLISAAQTLLNGKVDLNMLITLFTAYFTKQGASNAKSEASSISNKIASAVDLNTVSTVVDLVGKLNNSGSADLAKTLQSAIGLIKK